MWNDFPKKTEVNREIFDKEITREPAKTQFVMFFTPRSGSSWLTDIAFKTGRLSNPGETFNPNFLHTMVRALNATNMDEYCEILARRRNTHGVFGFQITYHQLRAVFKNDEDFMRRFPCRKCFWLIREDIVLQGVSLYKMQSTKIGHAPSADASSIQKAENALVYDKGEIQRWIKHIRLAEIGNENLFERFDLKPYRMSYEKNMAVRPARVVNKIAARLNLDPIRGVKLKSQHTKIGTTINDEFAERFRADMPGFVERIDQERSDMLAKIPVIQQRN